MSIAPDLAPIFIVGFSRSGTSLLRAMLNAHPNIFIAQESGFYQWLRPDRLRACRTAADWVQGYRRTAGFRLLGVDPGPALASLPNDAPRSAAGPLLLPALLGAPARALGRTRWGDKTPLNSLQLDAIFRDFPDARVVHVTRHPVGVADSLQRMPWGCDCGVFNGLLYRQVSAAVSRPGHRVLRVRLEDLVADPRGQLSAVLDHVGEPWSETVLSHGSHAPPNHDPPLPWLTQASAPLAGQAPVRLCPAAVRWIERAAGPALAAEGYTPTPLPLEPTWGASAEELIGDLRRGLAFLAHALRTAPPREPAEAIDGLAQLRFLFHLNASSAVPPAWREIPPALTQLLEKPIT